METIKSEFLEESDILLNKIIKKTQDDYNNKKFIKKNSNDMIRCLICDVNFRRGNRSGHERTKRHCGNFKRVYNKCMNIPNKN